MYLVRRILQLYSRIVLQSTCINQNWSNTKFSMKFSILMYVEYEQLRARPVRNLIRRARAWQQCMAAEHGVPRQYQDLVSTECMLVHEKCATRVERCWIVPGVFAVFRVCTHKKQV